MTRVRSGGIVPVLQVSLGCLVMAGVLLVAAPADAKLSGPCSGSATIDGIEYDATYDTPQRPIVIPERRTGLQIPYKGSITVANTNYLGAVGVVVGPATITVADWGFEENDDDVRSTDPGATYVLGSDLDDLVGLYRVTAFHDADGGSCDADAYVKLEGPVLTTPIGAGSTAGTVLLGVGLLAAGRARKGIA